MEQLQWKSDSSLNAKKCLATIQTMTWLFKTQHIDLDAEYEIYNENDSLPFSTDEIQALDFELFGDDKTNSEAENVL